MVILADFSDTQFLMTCKRCEQTLQEGDRFCRYCGQDQLEEDDPEAVIDITQPASNGDSVAPVVPGAAASARRQPPRATADSGRPGDTPERKRKTNGVGRPWRRFASFTALVLAVLVAVLLLEIYRPREEPMPPSSAQGEQGAAQSPVAARVEPTVPAPVHVQTRPVPSAASVGPAGAEPATSRRPAGAATATVEAPPPTRGPEPQVSSAAPAISSPAPVSESTAARPSSAAAAAADPKAAPPPTAEPPRQGGGGCSAALAALALCPNQ